MNEDARLMHWLSSHRDEAASAADPGLASAHVDVDTLTRHATGRLSPAQAHAVTEHLLVCDDARCVAFVRAQSSDVDAAADFLYPPNDERSSSPRTFQCKETLWTMIAEVAAHTGHNIDEVINDAMLQYARSRGYHEGPTARRPGEESPLEATQDAAAFVRRSSDQLRSMGSITTSTARGEEDLSESEPSARSRAAAHQSITAQRSPALTPEAVPRAPPSVRSPAARPMTMPASMPPLPGAPAPGALPPPARRLPPPPAAAARSVAPPSSRRAPPPLPLPSTPHMPIAPPARGSAMGSMSLSKRLVLTYEGQTYDVDKEHFIIGRSKGQADLRLDDPNVSRQHAAIERIGSIYYLVDLGSTNGVYVGDDRVTRRALVDGDTIVITNHRIACRLG